MGVSPIVKNWTFVVYDVDRKNSIEIAFYDSYGNQNLHFSLENSSVKSWGSLDKENIRKNQRITVKKAFLKAGIAGFWLTNAELDK